MLFRRKGRVLSGRELAVWEKEGPLYDPVAHERSRMDQGGPRFVRERDGSYCLAAKADASDAPSASIVCVGDILCEAKMYAAHKNARGRGFDFTSVYQFVRPLIEDADLAMANLETMICASAPYTGEQHKVGGKYHNNAPVEFLDAVKSAGFDFLMLANNHNLDAGVNGVVETLQRIDERGFIRTGLFAPGELRGGALVTVNGIRLGLLAYSTWFNRNEGRLTDKGRRQMLSEYSKEQVEDDVADLRSRGAEFVLAYLHWGIDAEYQRVQSSTMERLAKEAANAGVDYIVGSHTHSVQPYALVVADDGKVVPCVYSMGNFVTSEISTVARDSVLLNLLLKRAGDKVVVAEETFIPCHVPDSLLGIGFPVLPKTKATQDDSALAKYLSCFAQTERTLGYDKAREGAGFSLTKKKLCAMLGLPEPDVDEGYTSLRFAKDSVPGCMAVVSDITSDPRYTTSERRCVELAEEAMRKGAKALLSPVQVKGYPCLTVADPFEAFCQVIAAIRHSFSPKTVSVTGSIGKTTTTEMVRTLLRSKYKYVHANTGSANNVRYCGTVVQGLKTGHEFYVQELMEGPPYGAASTISKMVQPQASIVTVVGTSHLEHFGSQERILESCLGVQDGMPEDGLLILNGDDEFQKNARPRLQAVYYGIDDESADYRAVNIRGERQALLFDVVHGGEVASVSLRCFGRHNVLDALAAFAVGKWAGMTDSEITDGLARYQPTGIRQNLVSFGGYSLYLDCYNSSPESVASALDALSMVDVPRGSRVIAVLADVLEVGDSWRDAHEAIGRMAARSCADACLCYGKCARFIARAAREEGMKDVFHAETSEELIALIKEHVHRGDVVLFKGSHGMALEHVVDQIWGTWYHEEFERYDFLVHAAHDENFEYQVYTDHVTVVKKTSAAASVVVPDSIEGLPVTGVADSVFNRSRYTEKVQLPRTLRNIRYCSFYQANKIVRVEIPASVQIIHASAFSTCDNLQEVVIEPGCTHIGRRAFGNCRNLERIAIPETVAQIDTEAFLNCGRLTIYGKRGSCAEAYAASEDIAFKEDDFACLLACGDVSSKGM